MNAWVADPRWAGEQVFVVAGGPSVNEQNLDLLRGRRVIVINSSVHTVPWADVLVFGDTRWWGVKENKEAIENFGGLVVTTSNVRGANIYNARKTSPPGLARDRDALMMRRTTLTAAINLAAHFGASQIVLLGADGKKAPDGRTHHHKPHKWPNRPGCWQEQRKDLCSIVEPLKKLGVEVLNASPGSAWDMWPVVRLEDVLQEDRVAA